MEEPAIPSDVIFPAAAKNQGAVEALSEVGDSGRLGDRSGQSVVGKKLSRDLGRNRVGVVGGGIRQRWRRGTAGNHTRDGGCRRVEKAASSGCLHPILRRYATCLTDPWKAMIVGQGNGRYFVIIRRGGAVGVGAGGEIVNVT